MNVFSTVMPPSVAGCVSVWRGRQSVRDLKNWKFICVGFCLFTVGCRAREHVTMTWINCDVSVRHQMLYKSKFRNKFSFCCFYILCIWPSQEVKSRFHHVSLLASSLDQCFGQSQKNFRSTTVSLGIRLLTHLKSKQEVKVNLSFLEIKASWGQ